MKKSAFIILIITTRLFAGFEYSYTSICGGLALLPGGSTYPGVFTSLETNTDFYKYLSLGMHIDYTWFAKKGERKAGYNFAGLGAVVKGYLNVNNDVRAFVEFDPGFILAIAYFPTKEGLTDFEFAARYGQTYGVGINLKQFVLGLKMKQIFTYRNITGLWLNLYAGYTGL